jgi:hypothetical protein
VHILVEIERGIILVFQGKIPGRISGFNYRWLMHHFTMIILPGVHQISGFVPTSCTKNKMQGIPAASHQWLLLGGTMECTESFNHCTGINPDYLAAGE